MAAAFAQGHDTKDVRFGLNCKGNGVCMIKAWHKVSLSAKRRAVQLGALLMLHSSWGPEAKWLCMPVLNCHSCRLAWFACPIGVLVHYIGLHLFPFVAIGTVLLLGVLAGRLFCGWICPFGFLQDMLHKIPSPKFHLPDWASWGKYAVLALTVVLLPLFLGAETLLSFCRFCPASALQVTLPGFVQAGIGDFSAMTALKLAVLAVVVIGVILYSRAFCRVLCPIGAMFAPLNYVSLWKIKSPTEDCRRCVTCRQACPQEDRPGDRIAAGIAANRALDCIVCHECQAACPETNTPDASKAVSSRPDERP